MTLAAAGDSAEISVLVPAKDEAENLVEFVRQFVEALEHAPFTAELVVIDDGSVDQTPAVLQDLTGQHHFLRVVTHRKQQGIAHALRSGADAAAGRILVFYPADLQFLPSDIPSLVSPIREGHADVVTGTKQGKYEKAVVSAMYNRLCRWLFGVRVTDLNAVKAYRREVMDVVPNRPDWHRFMVVVAAAHGFRIAETPVILKPRLAGESKFGLGRIPVGATDLLSVWFQLRFARKPMLFFGMIGGSLFAIGFLTGLTALVLRFGFGYGFRPLLDLVMVLVVSGIALFGFGFIGEMVANLREEVRVLDRTVRAMQSTRNKPED
jgi:glycosyltransferase involved in cell wall biosynthesis